MPPIPSGPRPLPIDLAAGPIDGIYASTRTKVDSQPPSKRSALMLITFGSWDREAERGEARGNGKAGRRHPPSIDLALGPIDGVRWVTLRSSQRFATRLSSSARWATR